MSLKNLKEKALKAWLSLPERARKEITSFIHTFVAAFCFFVVNNVDSVNWSKESLLAFGLSAMRTALKISWNKWRESRRIP